MTNQSDETSKSSPYAGRWVARLQGRIIAHGGTPEQALLAAQKSRHKEKPEISYMHPDTSLIFPPLIEQVRTALPDKEIYLVGGAVRDVLLGRLSHDFDFTVPTNAIALARHLAAVLNAGFYVLDEEFDAARVIVTDPAGVRDFLDFTSYRKKESTRFDQDDLKTGKKMQGAARETLFLENALSAELRGRDFTINAMAMDLRDQSLHDPLGGASDLRKKVLRACSQNSFIDDPIRILRALRQAAAFGFTIEPETRKAMKASVGLLGMVSPERQRDELFKIMDGAVPAVCLRALEIIGALPHLLPEVPLMKGVEQSPPHVYDVWQHTLSVIENLDKILHVLTPGFDAVDSNDVFTGLLSIRLGRFRDQFGSHFKQHLNADRSLRALLIFAALYHDVSKPATRFVDETGRTRFLGHDIQGAEIAAARGRALKMSNGEIRHLEVIIANHMRFHFHVSRMDGEGKTPSRKSIYRFFRDTKTAGIDLILLGLADLRGMRSTTLTQEGWTSALDTARIFLDNYWEKPEESVTPKRLVNGAEVMQAFDLNASPLIGEVLEAIREGQAMGKISNQTDALNFARGWLKEHQS